ncbi:MAG TPA: hypothetical protein VKB57_10830 [Acidimicrobiales bacterium]|nr:hypothetical protein [Acidimicrobiales bacterium]
MNRAMGFGVLTGTMMGTTVIAAGPASAHVLTQLLSSQASVSIISDHTVMQVADSSCYDGLVVVGQYKVDPGGGRPVATRTLAVPEPSPCVAGAVSVDYMNVEAGAYAFRKCMYDGSNFACHDWQAIT